MSGASLIGAAAAHPAPSVGAAPALERSASTDVPGARAPDTVAPPCYSLNSTICVAVQNDSVPNIIPVAGSHISALHPSPNATISLWVESKFSLYWGSSAKTNGPNSPLSLNVTGVLWNGVPYYSTVDGTVWHPPGTDWWSYGPTGINTSYPYFYGLNFTPKEANGAPSWFAGMTVTWWVYIVSNSSGVLSHLAPPVVPTFQFTFGGAWAFSPYAGAAQYAGPAAAGEDLTVTQTPTAPNFNDSVYLKIATTPDDLVYGATIGGAYADLVEYAPDGALLASQTLTFPVSAAGTSGQVNSSVKVSAALAHTPGALVEYRVTAFDTNIYGPDEIQTAQYNYTVGGNGSFPSRFFTDDLNLTTSPGGISTTGVPASVPAGEPVHLLLTSVNAGTSIYSAEVVYTFNYAPTGEHVISQVNLARINSTNFNGTLPAMPLDAEVNFTVYAWDFSQTQVVSKTYSYATPTVAHFLPTVPTNSTFFVVFVYDNGTHTWVSGANVEITNPSGYVHVDATTFDGVAYPNQTSRAFVPLLLQAGATYQITVNDSAFHPGGIATAPSVSVSFVATHNLTAQSILEVGTDFTVAESGSAIFFWLNQTAPTITYSPPAALGTPTLLAAGIGLAAFSIGIIPLMMWYSRIQARRVAQEKRITL